MAKAGLSTKEVISRADSQMKDVLDMLESFQMPPYPSLSAENARE